MEKKFKEKLDTKIFGQNIVVFNEITSTNTKMLESLDSEDLAEGTVFLALKQTEGKGSFGNNWDSIKPLGMYISILIYETFKKNPLSFVPAVALEKTLKNYYGIESHLKWPNDILVGSKKISGILCQVKKTKFNKVACVVGIGVNIFQEREDFDITIQEKAISMKMIKNENYKLEDVYKNYIKTFEDVYFSNENIVSSFKSHSNIIGKNIKAKKDGVYVEAKVIDITEEGYLKVLVNNKTEIWISRTSLDIDTNY